MATVRPGDLDFRSFDGFVSFLQDKLNWPIKEEFSKESLTYEFLPEELRIEEKQLRCLKGDSIYQLIPFTKEQPWGIFFLELNNPEVYTTFLRRILRGLVPSNRKKSSILPTWQLENLLFICTYNYEKFTFAHFKGKQYQKAKLSTFGWTSGETRLRTLCEFNLPPLFYDEEFKYNHQEWLTEWSEAFDKEKLTKEFFEAYKFALEFIKKLLLAQNKASSQKVHSFAQQLLSRIMFLYFVEKKGWLKWKDYVQDRKYIWNLWMKYKEYKTHENAFYSLWLSSLFFQAFNKKHGYLNLNLPEEIKESFNLMPFLNGGLFTENELDKIGFNIPDEIFGLLFEIDNYNKKKGFLERYNFTIREDTPFEVEVAVDPEMLGKVYESLISEEERGKAGIFYTPRTEIDYMCRLSLVEYLFGETKISKEELIPLIFEPQTILEYEVETSLKEIKRALDKVKVVDPAVGSASFLVGMMNVLVDIQKNLTWKIDKRKENLFALKNKVISENLYGVDVKDWAVMVGELRLWLSLIIETEELYMDIYTKPLLPNLTFKIRQGDSLVEEIAGISLSLRGKFKYIPEPIKKKLTEIIDKKGEYFRSARLDKKKEIEDLEIKLFIDIVMNEVERIEEEIKKLETRVSFPVKQLRLIKMRPEQEELFREQAKRIKVKIDNLRIEQGNFQKVLENIGKKKSKDYFLWEIDFPEIFAEKGGFDIVIGNPPYVRQEKIAFPLERELDYKDSEKWKARKRLYKEKLSNSVRINWGNFAKINKKSDLYIYFYYAGLSLLHPDGVFCFINSNSWLDVGYGTRLQEFLLKNMEPVYIIDNQAKRSFKESDINTIIVVIKRPKETKDNTVKFINYKKPFEEVLTSDNLIEIEQSSNVKSTDYFRVFPISRKELLKDGVELPEKETLLKEPENLPYIGSKWGGKYLRAPDIFFKILEKGEEKLVKFNHVIQYDYGIKPGAVDFFYLTEDEINRRGIEDQFLRPIITSSQSLTGFWVKPDRYLFYCDKSVEELQGTGALDYIKWGESKGFHLIPSVRSHRPYWYALHGKPVEFLLLQFWDKRFWTPVAKDEVFCSNNFFFGRSKGSDKYALGGLLNSTLYLFQIEIIGRVNQGLGVLNTYGLDFPHLLIPDPYLFDSSEVADTFLMLAHRNILPIFEEVKQSDRLALDQLVFDAIGLTQGEREGVYEAMLELVESRLSKAKSLSRR